MQFAFTFAFDHNSTKPNRRLFVGKGEKMTNKITALYCRHAFYAPKRENGKIWCKECESKHKIEERKKSRKNVILAASNQAAKDSLPFKKDEEDDE